MKKQVAAIVFSSIFLLSIMVSVRSTVTVDSTVEDNAHVLVKLENLDPTLYAEAKNNPIFNGSAITQAIVQNLAKDSRTKVTYDFEDNTYDAANRAIGVSFHLGGADIITSEVDRANLKRNYEFSTDWRKFKVNLTSNVSIDFALYFAEPVEKWQQTSYTDSAGTAHIAYYFETGEIAELGKMSLRFILPSIATNVQATGDTITYDVPLGLEDVFIGTPFLMLAVILIAALIALVYRRVK